VCPKPVTIQYLHIGRKGGSPKHQWVDPLFQQSLGCYAWFARSCADHVTTWPVDGWRQRLKLGAPFEADKRINGKYVECKTVNLRCDRLSTTYACAHAPRVQKELNPVSKAKWLKVETAGKKRKPKVNNNTLYIYKVKLKLHCLVRTNMFLS